MEPKYVLVVGGAGYIGTHTVVALAEAGYMPLILDNFSTSDPRGYKGLKHILGKLPPLHIGDASEEQTVKKLLKQYAPLHGVIHFAALKSVSESIERPLEYYRNNLASLWNVLQSNPLRVVFSSSCTVYGLPEILPVREQMPLKEARSPYGYTKQIGERILSDYCHSTKNRGVSLRYFNPIGAHRSAQIGELPIGSPSNLVPSITQAVSKAEPLRVYGTDYETPDGSCLRDYIHVMDLAEAHVSALRWLEQQPKGQYEVFNCGLGKGYSVLEVITTFENTCKQKLITQLAPRRAGDIAQIYASVDKARDQLQWRATRSLAQGLQSAWEWQQKLLDRA